MVETSAIGADPLSAVVEFRPSARSVLRTACANGGRQAVLLSWPGGAAYLPARCFCPSPFDAVMGHVAGCPVYADRRQLGLFLDRRVVVDAPRSDPHAPVPLSVHVERLAGGRALDDKFAIIADALADELTGRLAVGADRAEIRAQVGAALDNLRGSVSLDSLAEMAIRLAEHRLTTGRSVVQNGGPAEAACCEVTRRAIGRPHRVRGGRRGDPEPLGQS